MRNAMWRTGRVAAVMLTMGLAGCASMSEQECLSADWYSQGMLDGQRGQPQGYIGEHYKACAKVGIVPDNVRYVAGWDKGIRSYCTPQNGERSGLSGSNYRQSCPAELQPAFLERYRAGRQVYDARDKLDKLHKEIERKESQMSREKDDKKRKRLREELRRLDRKLPDARYEVRAAERRLDR